LYYATVGTLGALVLCGLVPHPGDGPVGEPTGITDRIPPSGAAAPAGETDQLYYEPNRCGPTALCGACVALGIEASINELANLSGTDRKGTSIAGLVRAAGKKGLNAHAHRSSLTHLMRLRGPAIIDYPAGHFCVFCGWENGRARI